MPIGYEEKIQINQSVLVRFLAVDRQVEDAFFSPALNLFRLTDQFFRLSGVPEV